jgi:hypothetical protein
MDDGAVVGPCMLGVHGLWRRDGLSALSAGGYLCEARGDHDGADARFCRLERGLHLWGDGMAPW